MVFQVFRGALWVLLAVYIGYSMSGPIIIRAIIVGAAFSVLAAAQLLYPNPYMPWEVRLPHLIEVGISNFVFGALAVAILFASQKSER